MPAAGTRSVVTETERRMAADLLADWSLGWRDGTRLSTADQLHLLGMLTAALADARDGAAVPGERQLVEAHMDISRQRAQDVLALPHHRAPVVERLRMSWAAQLEKAGLRPLGWPPVTTTHLRRRAIDGTEQPPTIGDPYVECDEADAELVRLSIRGLAVPA